MPFNFAIGSDQTVPPHAALPKSQEIDIIALFNTRDTGTTGFTEIAVPGYQQNQKMSSGLQVVQGEQPGEDLSGIVIYPNRFLS